MTVESVNRIVKFGIYQELVSALFYNRFRIADLTIYSTICQCTGLDLELIVRKKSSRSASLRSWEGGSCRT